MVGVSAVTDFVLWAPSEKQRNFRRLRRGRFFSSTAKLGKEDGGEMGKAIPRELPRDKNE